MNEPKKILKCVTVTGADDTVDLVDLLDLQNEFPYVEFGILLSCKYSMKEGTARFPSRGWLRELELESSEAISQARLRLSGHVCGDWVRMIYRGVWPEDLTVVCGRSPFRRFQLNTHGETHGVLAAGLLAMARSAAVFNQELIFQLDNNSGNEGAELMMKHDQRNTSGLFDLSHGAGVLPAQWPKPIPLPWCGYAGGLSVGNVQEQLMRIQELTTETWIDAETHLRGSFEDKFDIELVYKFLKAAQPWVIE